jgi:hypothetical protein
MAGFGLHKVTLPSADSGRFASIQRRLINTNTYSIGQCTVQIYVPAGRRLICRLGFLTETLVHARKSDHFSAGGLWSSRQSFSHGLDLQPLSR